MSEFAGDSFSILYKFMSPEITSINSIKQSLQHPPIQSRIGVGFQLTWQTKLWTASPSPTTSNVVSFALCGSLPSQRRSLTVQPLKMSNPLTSCFQVATCQTILASSSTPSLVLSPNYKRLTVYISLRSVVFASLALQMDGSSRPMILSSSTSTLS